MAQLADLLAFAREPSLKGKTPDLFSELRGFLGFLWDELKSFPGRSQALVRLVVAVVATVLISETLRIPNPAFSAYLVFFVANEDVATSVKLGLAALAGLTVSLIAAMAVTICFMDAPWLRLPATFILMAGAIWLSRVLVLAMLGRMMAVILALYLSLADTIFDAETLTRAILWLWSGVALSLGVTVLTNLLLEPRADLLLRAQMVASLESVQRSLEALLAGSRDRSAQAKSLRRLVYASPARMRQLLARWRQRNWPVLQADVDWELGISITERLLSITAAVAALDHPVRDKRLRHVWGQLGQSVANLKQAVQDRNHEAIRSLVLPVADDLSDSDDKAAIIEIISTLSQCRFVLAPLASPPSGPLPGERKVQPKQGLLLPDALTNPEYGYFTLKTILAILACEIFMNAVAWPGIRTSMITCAVTALATVGAQRQKQLLRLTGACVGGLMGLASVLYLVPRMDSIVGLILLIASGTACCAWVAAGSVRSSYAGFQMALAFFIVLLPGFETSIDLTGIRDRFAGILVGITAMWIFFDHLWHTSSRRQLADKLVALLRVMAEGPNIVSSAKTVEEARAEATLFRRKIYGELNAARSLLDETKIELTLAITPRAVRGDQLEKMAKTVSFAAFLLLALNEKKLRALASGNLASLQLLLQPVDDVLGRGLSDLAHRFHDFLEMASRLTDLNPTPVSLHPFGPDLPSLPENELKGLELYPIYESLQDCLKRMGELSWVVRALPE